MTTPNARKPDLTWYETLLRTRELLATTNDDQVTVPREDLTVLTGTSWATITIATAHHSPVTIAVPLHDPAPDNLDLAEDVYSAVNQRRDPETPTITRDDVVALAIQHATHHRIPVPSCFAAGDHVTITRDGIARSYVCTRTGFDVAAPDHHQ